MRKIKQKKILWFIFFLSVLGGVVCSRLWLKNEPLEQRPATQAETLRIKGEALLKQGRRGHWTQFETVQEARKTLEQSLALDDSDPVAHRSLGIACGILKMEEEAEKELKRALELNSQDYIAHNNLSYLYKLQGRNSKARREWIESLKINPGQLLGFLKK